MIVKDGSVLRLRQVSRRLRALQTRGRAPSANVPSRETGTCGGPRRLAYLRERADSSARRHSFVGLRHRPARTGANGCSDLAATGAESDHENPPLSIGVDTGQRNPFFSRSPSDPTRPPRRQARPRQSATAGLNRRPNPALSSSFLSHCCATLALYVNCHHPLNVNRRSPCPPSLRPFVNERA